MLFIRALSRHNAKHSNQSEQTRRVLNQSGAEISRDLAYARFLALGTGCG